MKKIKIISMLAVAAVSFPTLAYAQREISDVDSTLTFALKVTKEGESREGRNGVTSRFESSRFGPRELIEAVADMGPLIEGGDDPAFPRGSRLMIVDGAIWIVSRQGETLMNISDYFSIKFASEPIVAGTFREGSVNSQTMYLASIGFNLGDIKAVGASEGSEGLDSSMSGSTRGIASNRSTSRSQSRPGSFRETLSSSTTGRVQGSGQDNDDPTVIEGSYRVSGREVRVVD